MISGARGKWLARGIAIAVSLAAVQANACKLHTMTLNGLQTDHPASVSVSLATRLALDNGQLTELPQTTRESKLNALADVEAAVLSAVSSLSHAGSAPAPVFSLYLTESAHWIRFIPNASGWTPRYHQMSAEEGELVIVVSDTAMWGLLIDELTVADAQALGVMVTSGDHPGKELALSAIRASLDGFDPHGGEYARLE